MMIIYIFLFPNFPIIQNFAFESQSFFCDFLDTIQAKKMPLTGTFFLFRILLLLRLLLHDVENRYFQAVLPASHP